LKKWLNGCKVGSQGREVAIVWTKLRPDTVRRNLRVITKGVPQGWGRLEVLNLDKSGRKKERANHYTRSSMEADSEARGQEAQKVGFNV
jgi:hypothetical protein